MPQRLPYVYVVSTHTEHGIDYNKNGRLSPGDDVVKRMKYNPKIKKYDILDGIRFINKQVQRKIMKIIDQRSGGGVPPEVNQRVVYKNVPQSDPPPVVFKEETSFGQHFKGAVAFGAGATLGQAAMEGVIGALGSLFSGEGGASRARPKTA